MKRTVKITLCGVFAAIIFVFTFLIPIPNGLGGYINFGDGIIILAGAFLGGPLGAAAGAVGSALADLAASYAVFVPATFAIKGLMGLVSGVLLFGKPVKLPRVIIAAVACEAVMLAGYFVFELFLYGLSGAAVELIFNGVQALAGILVAVVLIFAAEKSHIFKGDR